jgi:hypothetical protein
VPTRQIESQLPVSIALNPKRIHSHTRARHANCALLAVAYPERCVLSFQITILKVLSGHPDGRASLREVRLAVSVLTSSGPDWTDRMRRLASLVPELDIFSRSFVTRDDHGWQITERGLRFLTLLEAGVVPRKSVVLQISEIVPVVSQPAPLPPRLIGMKKRTSRRNRVDRNRRSAA